MIADIVNKVRSCQICQKYSRKQIKEPLMPHELPKKPFEKIAADIFELDGQKFLLVADYFSKMPFVKSLKTLTSKETILHLESILSVHGIPNILITDNGTQFTSEEFATFSKTWDFTHITSSPHYPQSNGFIERAVQTVKNCLKKSKAAGTDPQLALLALRNTPLDHTTPSPSEILFGRQVQDSLPSSSCNTDGFEDIKAQLLRRQQRQKTYYDRGTKELPPLKEQQHINVQHPVSGKWSPAVVMSSADTHRSYVVKTPDGATLRRNRHHLNPPQDHSPEPCPSPVLTTTNNDLPSVFTKDNHPTAPITPHQSDVQGRVVTRAGRTSIPPRRLLEE